MTNLQDKFRGSLLGALLGDVAGAVVEAESPEYIASTYQSVDDILSTASVPEFTGPDWQVGRYTDDMQMMFCVAEWLLEGEAHLPERLLDRFAKAYEPWRRYGPGTAEILRIFPQYKSQWRELSTMMFPHGSHGNGSAMRVAPLGLAYHDNVEKLRSLAIESSRPTHSHPMAYQGCVLQAIAVATAVTSLDFRPENFLQPMRHALCYFSDLMQDTSRFARALDEIERGLQQGLSCKAMSLTIGTGVTAFEAVPMAIYCYLRHPDSYAQVIHEAVFGGGDTDTIACMSGAISGAFLGASAIPEHWLGAVREDKYSVRVIEVLADRLVQKYAGHE